MSLQQKFTEHLKSLPFLKKDEKQLLAVSGGVDSVVLCHLLHAAGYNFVIAHCNFQLRGEESERDEQFVRQLGKQLGKEVLVKEFDTKTFASEHKLSIQVAARELRYQWFREKVNESVSQQVIEQRETENEKRETRNERNAFILTAHHADDNLETVVMNFFRGTGLKGLTGMDTVFQRVCRPLLPFRKQEIRAYAGEQQLAFVEDSSNAESHYTRNYFRNELLPAVQTIFPQAEENMLNNIQRLGETEKIYSEAIEKILQKLVEIKGNEQHIPILKLQKQTGYKTVLWELIKDKNFTAAQINEVIKLMDAGNGSHVQSTTHRIIKNRRWLIIAPMQEQDNNTHVAINEATTHVSFAEGELHLQHNIPLEHLTILTDKNTATICADKLAWPLLMRRCKKGDYFYPLGMQKKKKISRFLIDQKLSPTEKENVWVLESNQKIVWVVGYRIDDRFKVEAASKAVLKMVLS